MNTLIMVVVMVVSMLLPILMAAGAIFWEKRQRRLQGRRSPVKDKLAHLPGEQLRARMTNLTDKKGASTLSIGAASGTYNAFPLAPRQVFGTLSLNF